MKQDKQTPQPEAPETKQNPIIRWVNDGFPPIDLNQQVTHVKELVNDYQQQAKDIELLREALQVYVEIVTNSHGLMPVILTPATKAINQALKQTEPAK